jgi:DNA-binding NarL/FixJ family response regulator
MGAERDAERIRGELRGLGIPSPDEAHIRKVWDEFGESERVVATLVSQGFTNFQVASRMSRSEHTVNYHLRKLFRKFGVGSRVELARIVNEILKSE